MGVKLTRDHVLKTALQLLDEVGLEALTMRRLAAVLRVQAGAIYWHFADKQALQDAMADAMMEGYLEPRPQGTWDERLAEIARRILACVSQHRDGARLTAEVLTPGPNMLVAAETMLEAFDAGGWTGRNALWASGVLGSYVVGFIMDVEGMKKMEGAGLASMIGAFQATLDPAHFPHLLGVAGDMPGMAEPRQISARFEFGLKLILDGLRVAPPRSQRPPKGQRARSARRRRPAPQ